MPLTQKKVQVICECLHAAAHGPFFPDGEFSALFGLTRKEAAGVSEEWPVAIKSYSNLAVAVNNWLNLLLCYPSKNKRELWGEYISVDRNGLVAIYAAWRRRPAPDMPRGHFERMM